MMLSNHILQKSINTACKLTGEEIGVYTPEGQPIVAFFDADESLSSTIKAFSSSVAESQTAAGKSFIKVIEDGRVEYILVTTDGDSAQAICKLVSFQIKELSEAYREKFDKENFIKNLLLDNLLLVDIYNRAAKLDIPIKERRVVMLLRFDKKAVYEDISKVKEGITLRDGDYVVTLAEDNLVIVKHLKEKETDEYIECYSQEILDCFPDNLKSGVRISYGKTVDELRYVSNSYKEAIMAMDVGEIFFKNRRIVSYSLLGIGRLVYQLPLPLCKMFIKEIFGDKNPDDFDEEMLITIDKFFENSLNVSETSRQLYIHRNTLVYRLDKLEKTTGLDLRTFEDAITFKIAMMVAEYMKYMEV